MPTDLPPPQDRIPDIRRFRVTTFAVGLIAGVMSALLGVGGGLLMVPAMALFLHIRQQRAVATSLAVIIPTALAGAYRYHREALLRGTPGLDLTVVLWLAAGGVIGGVIGAMIANAIGAKQLRQIFGAFVIAVGIVMLTRLTENIPRALFGAGGVNGLQLMGVGVLVGTLSGLLGVGGGLVMVPVLVLLLGYDQHLAQGTSLAVIIPVSLSGTFIHVRKGNVVWDFAKWLSIGAVIGAWVTGGLVFAIPNETLRIMFAVFMIFMGFTMVRTRPLPADAAAPPAGPATGK